MIPQRDLSLLANRLAGQGGRRIPEGRDRAQTVALLDRARSEPRDLYDLWFLTAGGHVRLPDLVDPVVRKLEFRGLTLAQVGGQFAGAPGVRLAQAP